VTGATSGIGAATAEGLASRGATVVVVGRSSSRCVATAEAIRRATGSSAVESLVADLSSRADVHELSRQFRARHRRLDVLVNNAGGIFMRRRETVDGLEMTFALNHLAYFLLTDLLLDVLLASAPARIVNVSSSGHHLVRGIRFEDVQMRGRYRGFEAYGQSKLANLLFTYELARRLEGTGVTVNAVHPGFVATNIGTNNTWTWRLLKPLYDRYRRIRYLTPEEGARTVLHLAVSPEVEGVTGGYFADGRPVESSAASRDEAAARRLWQISEALAGSGAAARG
jgi:NAD(P)-dependent dehydrogenase (short-subunit alcohol dehydrogenase family)